MEFKLMDIGDFFRKATRPAVTIIFAAVIAQVVVERIDAPNWFLGLAATVILWWFGDRTRQHIRSGGASPRPKGRVNPSSPSKGKVPSPLKGEGQGEGE